MAKDRMDAGRGRGKSVKSGAPAKKVEIRGNDKRPFYAILGVIAAAAAVFIVYQMSEAKSSGVMAEMSGIASRTKALAGRSLERAQAALARVEVVDAIEEAAVRAEFAGYFEAAA